MENTITINGVEYVRKDQVTQVEQIINEQPEKKPVKRWRAECPERYWYIDSKTTSVSSRLEGHEFNDDARYNIGNYYQTKELAQQALDKQVAITKINDTIYEMQDGKVEYEYGNYEYVIVCNTDKDWQDGNIFWDGLLHLAVNPLHWMTIETVKYIIDNYQDELKLIMGIK